METVVSANFYETNELVTEQDSVEELINQLFPTRQLDTILLIQPPDATAELFNFNTAQNGRYWNFPAYGLGIIATQLRSIDTNVDIVNLNHQILKKAKQSNSADEFNFDYTWQSHLKNIIDKQQPQLIGISAMFTQTHPSLIKICQYLKSNYPQVVIALGGVHITNSLADVKTRESFFKETEGLTELFFLYESDLSFINFVKKVNRLPDSGSLNQIIFRFKANFYEISQRIPPPEENIHIIPAHDLLNTQELSDYGKIGSFYSINKSDAKYTAVLANRGCRARCTFCSVSNFNGRGVRHKNTVTLIDELKILKNDFGINHIMWLDDDFFHDKKEKINLFNEMVKHNLNMTWDCTNGLIASSCTEDIISAAEESGCIGVNIGVESGNPVILKAIKKPGTIDTFLKAAEVFHKYQKINTRVFLMIGFPHETYQMINDTYQLALDMALDWYNITIYEPLPNTSLFNDMIKEGLINEYDYGNVRYNAGPYGKTREDAQKENLKCSVNMTIFDKQNPLKIPNRNELDEIWFHMNYHLNFKRLTKPFSKTKLEHQYRYMENVANLVAPDDAFATYFGIYMHYRYSGKINPIMLKRLTDRLNTSEYWQSRFREFGLSLNDISKKNFQNM